MPEEGVAPPAVEKKKRRKPVRLDAKTVKWLEDHGWCAGIVERRHGPFSFDFKGFADILAIRLRLAPLGVQVCRNTTRAEHRTKLLTGDGAPGVRQWLQQGGVVLIVCWDLRKDLNASRRGVGRQTWRVNAIDEIRFAEGQEDAPVGLLEAWDLDMNDANDMRVLTGSANAPPEVAAGARPSSQASPLPATGAALTTKET